MMTIAKSVVRGRFAPSPSGPLHFGSLVAAVGSYLTARAAGGQWLVRIEDIDTPRTQIGAADSILRTLDTFGLHWDGDIVYQSQRLDLYHDYFTQLQSRDLLYGCDCSRARISSLGGLYDGFCQHRQLTNGPLAWRLRAEGVATEFSDMILGACTISPALAQEHYSVKRRDGLFSYQLVVVIDDLSQGITQVIRGADLLDMTPRQQHLFGLLGATAPVYGHLPLAMASSDLKLSKQNHATAIERFPASLAMQAALEFLGQVVPKDLQGAAPAELLNYAVEHFSLQQVPKAAKVVTLDFA